MSHDETLTSPFPNPSILIRHAFCAHITHVVLPDEGRALGPKMTVFHTVLQIFKEDSD